MIMEAESVWKLRPLVTDSELIQDLGLKVTPRSRTVSALGPMECGLTNPARAGRQQR